jgi:prepilin-type N-terminal cleavage/methylation domain-containing protein
MKKKGFTLVELLAVITLIGILGLITVPVINNTIKNSRKKAFKETLNAIVESAKIYNADTDYLVITADNGIYVLDKNLKYENKSEILDGQLYYESGSYYFDYVYSKYYCAWGNIEDIEIYDISSDECN